MNIRLSPAAFWAHDIFDTTTEFVFLILFVYILARRFFCPLCIFFYLFRFVLYEESILAFFALDIGSFDRNLRRIDVVDRIALVAFYFHNLHLTV